MAAFVWLFLKFNPFYYALIWTLQFSVLFCILRLKHTSLSYEAFQLHYNWYYLLRWLLKFHTYMCTLLFWNLIYVQLCPTCKITNLPFCSTCIIHTVHFQLQDLYINYSYMEHLALYTNECTHSGISTDPWARGVMA